ncbi:MAG TPA: hypothetical protein VF788_05120 [Pseudonocardiaceae bacterium]|jgi:hypothetical protein
MLPRVGRDGDRLNRPYTAGWAVVFITAQRLREPRRLIQTVSTVLSATWRQAVHADRYGWLGRTAPRFLPGPIDQ